MRLGILVFVGLFAISSAAAEEKVTAEEVINFAVFGPGIYPCAEFSAAYSDASPRTTKQEFLLWLLGYYKSLESIGLPDLIGRVELEEQFNWLDRYCRENRLVPFRCAVDQSLRGTLDISATALLPSMDKCNQATNAALMVLQKRPGAPALDMRDRTSQSLSRPRARGVDLLRSPGPPTQDYVPSLRSPWRAAADDVEEDSKKQTPQQETGFVGGTLLGPVTTDAYGPGTHSDATGRSFTFRTRDGDKVQGPVQLDGYGLGVHMDQFGRPVRAVPNPFGIQSIEDR